MIPINLEKPFRLSHEPMSKIRVLLISSQHLFGEGMETLLRAEEDIETLGPWDLNDQDVSQRLIEAQPSVVIIADENLQNEAAAELTRSIIEQYPHISVIRTGLSEKIFRIFSTHTLPARGVNLLETIRNDMTSIQASSESAHP